LLVNPGPATSVTLSPLGATIASGGQAAFTATAKDAFNNSIGNVTAATTFTIAPDGSCTLNVCTATLTGPHTVTGTYGAVSGRATLQVNPGAPVILSPAQGAVMPKQVTVSGTAPLNSLVRLSDNGDQIADNVTVDGAGNWSRTLDFAGGTHNVVARAFIGTAVSEPSATRMFTVDASPPSSVVIRPSGYVLFQLVLPGQQPEVRGTASDQGLGIDRVQVTYTEFFTGAEVHSTLACAGACKSFAWVDNPDLGLGYWTAEAVAFDKAGNASAPASIDLLVIGLP
jgi:hypothetical protein